MEILKLLKKDHTEAKGLLKQIKKALDAEDTREAKNLFTELKRALIGHSKAEEKVLYNRLEEVDDEKTRDLAYESAEEHELVEHLLNKMENVDSASDKWCGEYMVLRELLEKHIKEEESDLFPKAKKEFEKDQLAEFGDEFQTEKERVLGEVGAERPIYSSEEQPALQ